MPEYLTKSAPIFFTHKDEDIFANRLRALVPDVQFIDGQRWDKSTPPAHELVTQCNSSFVYIWSPQVCRVLPHKAMSNGRFQGPTSGMVIQFGRCKYVNGLLLSGDMGIGYDKNNEAIFGFVDCVWNILMALRSAKLTSINIDTRQPIKTGINDYIVGPDAKDQAIEGTIFKHSSVDVFYIVE